MQATQSHNIYIYTEANPNPNSLKFVVDYMLLPEGVTFDFPDKASAAESPLAQLIFEQFGFVQRIFLMSNFITVTKDEATDWHEVAGEVKDFIKAYLMEGKPLLTKDLVNRYEQSLNESDAQDTETVKKIKGILNEYVRPAVESDGGAINFHSFEDGIVKVLLQGSCSGCPSSTITLKAGIENLLKRMLPDEVKEVVAEGI
ncbi:MAG TPA: NifU family protein [Microscillaceae bacterium]|jgi:Fe-S cluster biogenesis protein NfuA|nr:NifU family protein [Microscillaceae bacterium]